MAQGATSLGPKPSLFIYFCCFFGFFCSFPFFAFNRRTLFFPLKRAFFVYFLCFSFFLPQPFLTSPLFCFSFSVSLSLSLSCSCLSFFLLVFIFCFLFVSCFCLFFICLSSLLLFSEKNMKCLNCNLFFHQYFLFLWLAVLLFLSNPFSLSLFFFF